MPISISFQKIKTQLVHNSYINDSIIDGGRLSALSEAKNFRSLCSVLKESFSDFCRSDILEGRIIDLAIEEFNKYEIYHNTSVNRGYILISEPKKKQDADQSVIEINGEATVVVKGYAHVNISDRITGYAFDNSVIRAYCYATLYAYDNASVYAFGNTNIMAFDNSFIRADSYSSVESYNNASVRAMCKAKVNVKGSSKLVLMGSAVAIIIHNNTVIVEAMGESYLSSYGKIVCRLKEKAIYHDLDSNIIYYSDKNMQFTCTKKIELE